MFPGSLLRHIQLQAKTIPQGCFPKLTSPFAPVNINKSKAICSHLSKHTDKIAPWHLQVEMDLRSFQSKSLTGEARKWRGKRTESRMYSARPIAGPEPGIPASQPIEGPSAVSAVFIFWVPLKWERDYRVSQWKNWDLNFTGLSPMSPASHSSGEHPLACESGYLGLFCRGKDRISQPLPWEQQRSPSESAPTWTRSQCWWSVVLSDSAHVYRTHRSHTLLDCCNSYMNNK